MADTSQSSPPAAARGTTAGIDREIIVLGLVIVAGTIMAVLDTTIVNVALDTLGRHLHAELSTVQWVVTGYLLALGTVIPVTGWAIDRFGGKRVWMLSIVLFAGGSALCGLAWNIGSLIAFRALQGLGGGMLMPAGQTILTRAAGPERIGRVFSIIGIPMLLGPVVGPVLGGWLVQDADWRWIFFVNLPVGVLALVLAAWKMPPLDEVRGSGTLDVRGLMLLPPGFVLLIYGLSRAGSGGGFGKPSTIGWLAGGVVLVALFVLHSLDRKDRALIDVRLFLNRVFAASSFGAFLIGCALFGSLLLLPLYYQVARGEGALNAGLLLAPQGLGAAVMMPVAGLLTDKLGAGRVVPFGVALGLVGTVAFTQVHAGTSYWLLGASLFVRGLGLGATMMPTMSAAFATLTRQAVARATSAMNIIMQLGGSLGGALLAVLLSRAITSRLPAGAQAGGHLEQITPAVREKIAPILASAFGQTFWIAFGMMAAIIIPALLLPRHGTAAAPSNAQAPAL